MAVLCLAVVAVGLVDYATGPRWGLSLFYLMPVAWGAWHLNGRSRYLIACLAALSWFLADAPNYADLGPTLWNAGHSLGDLRWGRGLLRAHP